MRQIDPPLFVSHFVLELADLQKSALISALSSPPKSLVRFVTLCTYSAIKSEMQGLEFQKNNAFKSPPKEWIDFRLEKFYDTLNKNTKSSALALKELLGTIELDLFQGNVVVENGRLIEIKPYYIATSNIQTLALLNQEYKGLNWL